MLGTALGTGMLSTTTKDSLPYVVLRGASARPYYKRQIPSQLRSTAGASTVTVRLEGSPTGGPRDRARFAASYARADAQAEDALAAARAGQRVLTPQEQLGAAGSWARTAGPQHPDSVDRAEVAAILTAASVAGIVLPCPIPPNWAPGPIADERAMVDAADRLAWALHGLDHPGEVAPPSGGALWGDELITPASAAAFLAEAVVQARVGIEHWITTARQQLHHLGVMVPPDQQQAVALRLATTSAALGEQVRQIEHGQFPEPLRFPDPPPPSVAPQTVAAAFQRWVSIRSPAAKTRVDAERRLEEFRLFIGTGNLEQLTAQQVIDWRSHLLQGRCTATARKHLALVRAVFQCALTDGMGVPPDVIRQLAGTGLRRSDGTRQQRRPFTMAEATLLITTSRQQQGRPLDRWAFPLGLATGCRLEELAGLRPQDVREIDGIWVVVIEPHELRRLKNSNSTRSVPIPNVLLQEGFVAWAQKQSSGDLLFPEPKPPATDPRLSHYATIRLGRIIRQQAGITDPLAVFHSTRHFTAQQLVDAGSEQRMVEQILGHGSKSMTARYSRGGIPTPLLAAAMESRNWGWWLTT